MRQCKRKKAVRGVVYEDPEKTEHRIEADAVILTTGGYSFNSEMIKQYAPHIAHLSTTNGSFAMGEGIDLAAPLTPALRLMDQIQVHPTSFVDPNDINSHFRILAPEALRGSGGILLNHEGKRFVNELGLRDYVTKQIFEHCRPIKEGGPVVAYLLLSQEAADLFQKPNLGFYIFKKLVKEYSSVKTFGEEFGIDVAVIEESLKVYNQKKKEGGDEFGKKTFPAAFSVDEPVYAMMITSGIHYTMGGLQTNSNCEVESTHNNEPIPGLFAAGEVTGGLHGANRLGGNSLLECTVFGRMAGQQASK
uniref:fumarate reductase (NADH) n=1 Tax=Paramoeba aestuarina TaxID=180227 RepID=A0A7S4NZB9_9EUKA